VRGSIGLGRARARLRVELFASARALGRRGRGQALAGSVAKRSAGPGSVAVTVPLNRVAKGALQRGGSLRLVVRVSATPLAGGAPRTARATVVLTYRRTARV
jgi:hypothetical protein